MKKIKFLPVLMALFMGLTFGLTSCGDDDDDSSSNNGGTEFVETDVIESGRNFYSDLEKAANGSDSDKLRVAADALDYTKNKDNAAWTSNFLAGVVMQKYGVDDSNVAKTQEYMNKVADVKGLLDNGINKENVADALIKLASFIASK